MDLRWGLSLVFTELYKNKLDVKSFIVKPQEIQMMEVIEILEPVWFDCWFDENGKKIFKWEMRMENVEV